MKYDFFSELLHDAINGNPDAMNEILQLYMPLINRNSVVNSRFDEDCRQYILLRAASQIPKFKI